MTSLTDAASWWPPDFEFPGRAPAPPGPVPLPLVGEGALSLPELEAPSETAGMAGAEGTVRTALEEAYERGEADGRAAGAAQAESRVRSAVETLLSAAEAVRAAGEEFTRARARNLQALSLAVAGHLVQREVAADPEILARLTERALELAADDEVEVHLHPEDLALLEPRLSSLAPAGTTPAVRWTGDASMARGGVRVEGPQRLVDGRIETALRSIYERLEYDGHASR